MVLNTYGLGGVRRGQVVAVGRTVAELEVLGNEIAKGKR